MTSLDDKQQAVIDALSSILTEDATGFVRLYTDPADSYPEKPCLVLTDAGMLDRREGNSQMLVEWDIEIQAYLERADLADAHATARSYRAQLIETLYGHITLNGTVANSLWTDKVVIGQIEDGGVDYVGLTGTLQVHIKTSKSPS